MCLFEYVYFARPDSIARGRQRLRRAQGARPPPRRGAPVPRRRRLSSSPCPTRACPRRSATPRGRGVPFEMGLIRSHYVGPHLHRAAAVDPPLRRAPQAQPDRAGASQGKRVVVVDDSIVRGTTSRKIVRMVRDAGAREVHLRISSPPTRGPATTASTRRRARELIASSHSVDEIARLRRRRLARLPLARGARRVGARRRDRGAGPARPESRRPGESYCHACFSGQYPSAISPTKPRHLRLVNG